MMRLDEIGEYYNNIKAKVVSRPTRPNKHEEDRTVCMYRWRKTMFVAASQKKKCGKMWTRFDEGQCATIER